MALNQRLSAPTPCGYGRKYFFTYRGNTFESISTLIWTVVERMALLYKVEIETAYAYNLYTRLADRYGVNASLLSVVKNLGAGLAQKVHPRAAFERDRQAAWDKQNVLWATEHASGKYCVVGSTKRPCCICGRPTSFEVVNKRIATSVYCGSMYGVCLHERCQALKQLYPQAFRTTRTHPLVFILNEAAKDGNNSENKRRLEENFIHYAGQIHQWRTRRHISKNSRQAS